MTIIKKEEVFFNGTPIKFRNVIDTYCFESSGTVDTTPLGFSALQGGWDSENIRLIPKFREKLEYLVEIIACRLPSGYTRVVVKATENDWIILQPYWNKLTIHLGRLGYLLTPEEAVQVLDPQEHDQTNTPAEQTAERGKSGRPHLPEDIWAWEQVNIEHREQAMVLKEWQERVKTRNLVDPERHFKRIIKPEWYKGQK